MIDEVRLDRVTILTEDLKTLHAALDKAGKYLFPGEHAELLIKELIAQILFLHDRITIELELSPSLELASIADKALLSIIRASIKEASTIKDQSIMEGFNAYVRKCLDDKSAKSECRRIRRRIDSETGEMLGFERTDLQADGLDIIIRNGQIINLGMYGDYGLPCGIWATFDSKGNMTFTKDYSSLGPAPLEDKEIESLTKGFIDKISVWEEDGKIDYRGGEEPSMGAVLLGSVAALTASAFLNRAKNKKPGKVEKIKTKVGENVQQASMA